MENIDQALSSLRMMESNGDYNKQQSVKVDGTVDRKVGAYGIMESRWGTLTKAIGYPGARWQDRKMQDTIAKEKLQRDYQELKSWELAVVSFRYGMPVARGMAKHGMTEPKDIELAGYPNIANYMRNVRRYQKNDFPADGKHTKSLTNEDRPNPTLKKSESIIRQHLIKLRDTEKERRAKNGGNEDLLEGGDTGIPATPQ